MVQIWKRTGTEKTQAQSWVLPAKASPAELTPEAVAQRAYEKFLARGAQHGNDLQDWLEAERELKGEPVRGRA